MQRMHCECGATLADAATAADPIEEGLWSDLLFEEDAENDEATPPAAVERNGGEARVRLAEKAPSPFCQWGNPASATARWRNGWDS